jgi:hypothetical protein
MIDVSTTNSRNEDIMGALMGTFRDPLILIISGIYMYRYID